MRPTDLKNSQFTSCSAMLIRFNNAFRDFVRLLKNAFNLPGNLSFLYLYRSTWTNLIFSGRQMTRLGYFIYGCNTLTKTIPIVQRLRSLNNNKTFACSRQGGIDVLKLLFITSNFLEHLEINFCIHNKPPINGLLERAGFQTISI